MWKWFQMTVALLKVIIVFDKVVGLNKTFSSQIGCLKGCCDRSRAKANPKCSESEMSNFMYKKAAFFIMAEL